MRALYLSFGSSSPPVEKGLYHRNDFIGCWHSRVQGIGKQHLNLRPKWGSRNRWQGIVKISVVVN